MFKGSINPCTSSCTSLEFKTPYISIDDKYTIDLTLHILACSKIFLVPIIEISIVSTGFSIKNLDLVGEAPCIM